MGSAATKIDAKGRVSLRVDWTDRFLSRAWPFAQTAPLPEIDAPRLTARKQADQIATGNIFDGRPTMQLSRARLEELLEQATMSGIVSAVGHYASIDAARRTVSARMRRGSFRLWCVGSLFWLCFAVVAISVERRPLEALQSALIVFGPPLFVLIASVVLFRLGSWVLSGYRGGP
jgi:hypothetical protein